MFLGGRRPSSSAGRRRVFAGNPYMFLGRRPFRESRLRAYIVRQHCGGRALSEILDDPYVRACGSDSLCWKVATDPRTIEALERNVRDAFADLHP